MLTLLTANVSYRGYVFHFSDKTDTIRWITARDGCQRDGGHLTSIRSEDELNLILKFAYVY